MTEKHVAALPNELGTRSLPYVNQWHHQEVSGFRRGLSTLRIGWDMSIKQEETKQARIMPYKVYRSLSGMPPAKTRFSHPIYVQLINRQAAAGTVYGSPIRTEAEGKSSVGYHSSICSPIYTIETMGVKHKHSFKFACHIREVVK